MAMAMLCVCGQRGMYKMYIHMVHLTWRWPTHRDTAEWISLLCCILHHHHLSSLSSHPITTLTTTLNSFVGKILLIICHNTTTIFQDDDSLFFFLLAGHPWSSSNSTKKNCIIWVCTKIMKKNVKCVYTYARPKQVNYIPLRHRHNRNNHWLFI